MCGLMLSSMENFIVKEKFGKGAQSTAYLVERKETDQKWVLKKVECFDESEANKAYKEASALQDLQHPYVSGYKEFFVQWEQEDSSVYICILMDYFPKGTLEHIICKYRQKGEAIQEEIIKKWLGQIVEALVHVHKKKIIHRDVRPSNVYVQADDTLALGDFGVATIMGDAITCTRSAATSMNYMAPEVSIHGYSECSDVWSVGCVLFELVTAWMFDSNQVVSKLQEIRKEPMVLDELLEDISKYYSDALISVLRCMLQVTHTTRCTALGLLNMAFIKECVELSDSTQLAKRKRIQSASTQMSEIGPVPKKKGVYRVLEYLAQYVDYEMCVKDGLQYMVRLSKKAEGLDIDSKGKKLIAMAMKNHLTEKAIQIAGCQVLNSLVASADTNDVLFSPEVLVVIPYAMEAHKESPEVQLAAAVFLTSLSANGPGGAIAGQVGAVVDLLEALRTYPNNVPLCCACLNALWGLTVHGNNVKIATGEKGIRDVCNVFKLHLECSEIAEAASAAILALSLDDENLELISDMDGVGLLVNTLLLHEKNAKVVKNTCLALASLVEVDEESAYRVLSNEGLQGEHIAGVPIIMAMYELHKDNAEVVESVVTLFMELAEYETSAMDIMSFGVVHHLMFIERRFVLHKDIIEPCEKALERLRICKQNRQKVLDLQAAKEKEAEEAKEAEEKEKADAEEAKRQEEQAIEEAKRQTEQAIEEAQKQQERAIDEAKRLAEQSAAEDKEREQSAVVEQEGKSSDEKDQQLTEEKKEQEVVEEKKEQQSAEEQKAEQATV